MRARDTARRGPRRDDGDARRARRGARPGARASLAHASLPAPKAGCRHCRRRGSSRNGDSSARSRCKRRPTSWPCCSPQSVPGSRSRICAYAARTWPTCSSRSPAAHFATTRAVSRDRPCASRGLCQGHAAPAARPGGARVSDRRPDGRHHRSGVLAGELVRRRATRPGVLPLAGRRRRRRTGRARHSRPSRSTSRSSTPDSSPAAPRRCAFSSAERRARRW